jgi:methyl-accepting chemotaxis protein
MAQMDKVTQQNAANAEESASASEELSAQAEQMNEVVVQLAVLVGGSATAAKSGKTTQPKTQLSHSDQTFHQIAGGTTNRVTAKVAAAKAIPLDDDSGFDEFNS